MDPILALANPESSQQAPDSAEVNEQPQFEAVEEVTQQEEQVQIDPNLQPDLVAYTTWLESRLEQLERTIQSQPPQRPQVATEVIEPQQPVDFVTGTKLAERFEAEDLAALNEVLSQVYSKAREDATQSLVKKIPTYVQQSVTSYKDAETQAAEMWKANADILQDAKTPDQVKARHDMVAVYANQAAAQHPEWSFKQIADAAFTQVRTALGRSGQTIKRPTTGGNFPGTSGAPVKPAQQTQIKDPFMPYEPNSPEHVARLFGRRNAQQGVKK